MCHQREAFGHLIPLQQPIKGKRATRTSSWLSEPQGCVTLNSVLYVPGLASNLASMGRLLKMTTVSGDDTKLVMHDKHDGSQSSQRSTPPTCSSSMLRLTCCPSPGLHRTPHCYSSWGIKRRKCTHPLR